MTRRHLPKSVTALIHHVRLNESGWWDQALQRLIAAALLTADAPSMTASELAQRLLDAFGVPVDQLRLDRALRILAHQQMIDLTAGLVTLLGAARTQLEDEKLLHEQAEVEARSFFDNLLRARCPHIDPEATWVSFNSDVLTPLVCDLGARTYELLTCGPRDSVRNTSLDQYLSKYPAADRPQLRSAFGAFFDPDQPSVRAFVLNRMNAYFFLEASSLSEDSIKELQKVSSSPRPLKVFLDTNFLFSVLELHDNPSNEAARALIALIALISRNVSIKLYVATITKSEFQKSIARQEVALSDIVFSANVMQALRTESFSGVVRRYLQVCHTEKKRIRALDYFAPYSRHFLPTIRGKGIEYYNANIDSYLTDQRVIDDIEAQTEWEKAKPEHQRKTYHQHEHDYVLWHVVHDLRRGAGDSPIDVFDYVATIDFRLLAYDHFKRRSLGRGDVPVCLHPVALIQMLQLWIPRSLEYERAFLSNFRLPFAFQEYDALGERVTLRILETLSRYEDVADLSSDVVAAILYNDAIRDRIQSARDNDDCSRIVRDGIVSESKRLRAERDALQKIVGGIQEASASKDGTIDELVARAEKADATIADQIAARAELESDVATLRDAVSAMERTTAERAARRGYVMRYVVLPVATIVAGFGGIGLLALSGRNGLLPFAELFTALLFVLPFVVLLAGRRDGAVREAPAFRRFAGIMRWLRWLCGMLALGIAANLLTRVVEAVWRVLHPTS